MAGSNSQSCRHSETSAKSSRSLSPPAKHRIRRIRTLDTTPGGCFDSEMNTRCYEDTVSNQELCSVRGQNIARHSNIVGLPPTSVVSYQQSSLFSPKEQQLDDCDISPAERDSSLISFKISLYTFTLLIYSPQLCAWMDDLDSKSESFICPPCKTSSHVGDKELMQGLQIWSFWQTRSHISTWDTAYSGILADTALRAPYV